MIPFLLQNTFFFHIYFILIFSKSLHGSSNLENRILNRKNLILLHLSPSYFLILVREICPIRYQAWFRDHEELTLSFVEENVSIWIICILCFAFIKVYFCFFANFRAVFRVFLIFHVVFHFFRNFMLSYF